MKYIIKLLFVFIVFVSISAHAQEGWFWQNPLPQGNSLTDVFVIDQNTAIAVGWSGTIIKTTDGGLNWISQSSGTTNDLYSVHFVDDNTGWTVGSNGIILKTTNGGANWISQNSGTSAPLKSVYFINAYTGWIVGGFDGFSEGIILKTINGGYTWKFQNSGVASGLKSVFFVNSQIGWAVGNDAKIIKTTNGGNTWDKQDSGISWGTFNCVYFVNANTGWITGASGKILKTNDGGRNWVARSIDSAWSLCSVFFLDTSTGWAAGGIGDYAKIIKTTDGGTTWNIDTKVTLVPLELPPLNVKTAIGAPDALAKGAPVLAVSPSNPNELYIVYAADPDRNVAGDGPDDADIFLIKSTDGGNTWSTPLRINNDATVTDQILPWIDVKPDGTIDIAWFDRRNDPLGDQYWDVFIARSTNGGNSFVGNVQVNDTSFLTPLGGTWMGEYLGLVTDSTHAYVAWTTSATDGSGDVYYDTVPNSQIPEPATMSLLALGALAILKRRR